MGMNYETSREYSHSNCLDSSVCNAHTNDVHGRKIMIVFNNCQLEYDSTRGVLYVHNKDTGASILRICQLFKNPPALTKDRFGLLDITLKSNDKVSLTYEDH